MDVASTPSTEKPSLSLTYDGEGDQQPLLIRNANDKNPWVEHRDVLRLENAPPKFKTMAESLAASSEKIAWSTFKVMIQLR